MTAAKATAKSATTAAKATSTSVKAASGFVVGVFGSRQQSESYDTVDQIRAAQHGLQQKGYYRGAIDGISGPQTRAGIRKLKSEQGLEVTGELNAETAGKVGIR